MFVLKWNQLNQNRKGPTGSTVGPLQFRFFLRYGLITAGDGLGVEDAGAVPLPLPVVAGGVARVLRWTGAVGVAFAGN